MWRTNSGLTERDAYDSRPHHWPWLRRGIKQACQTLRPNSKSSVLARPEARIAATIHHQQATLGEVAANFKELCESKLGRDNQQKWGKAEKKRKELVSKFTRVTSKFERHTGKLALLWSDIGVLLTASE
jgi:hypothetical protein